MLTSLLLRMNLKTRTETKSTYSTPMVSSIFRFSLHAWEWLPCYCWLVELGTCVVKSITEWRKKVRLFSIRAECQNKRHTNHNIWYIILVVCSNLFHWMRLYEINMCEPRVKKWIWKRSAQAVAKLRPKKNSSPYGIWFHDVCDTGAVLDQY